MHLHALQHAEGEGEKIALKLAASLHLAYPPSHSKVVEPMQYAALQDAEGKKTALKLPLLGK